MVSEVSLFHSSRRAVGVGGALALLLALPWIAGAAGIITRSSLTQQFIVTGTGLDQPMFMVPPPGVEYVVLEPNTTVVSCERIKQAVLRELRLEDHWRDKIYLRLRASPPGADEERVQVEAESSPSGWTYRVSMPEQIGRRRFVSTMVELVLLEIANRRATESSFELSRWLGTGIAAGFEARGMVELVVDPFSRRSEVRRSDTALRALREHLTAVPALTLDELNWPAANRTPQQLEHYRLCSQLLVNELLHLDEGPLRLGRMLQRFPDHLNWQITFLEAFSPRFQRLVDFDKWWSVTVAHFTGRDTSNDLPAQVALDQLSEILKVPVDVRVRGSGTERTNAAMTTLQRVVASWDWSRLDPLLIRKMSQLEGLQWRAPKPVAALAVQYRESLGLFMRQRSAAGGTSTMKSEMLPNAKLWMKKTMRQLDELDRARSRLAQDTAHPAPAP